MVQLPADELGPVLNRIKRAQGQLAGVLRRARLTAASWVTTARGSPSWRPGCGSA